MGRATGRCERGRRKVAGWRGRSFCRSLQQSWEGGTPTRMGDAKAQSWLWCTCRGASNRGIRQHGAAVGGGKRPAAVALVGHTRTIECITTTPRSLSISVNPSQKMGPLPCHTMHPHTRVGHNKDSHRLKHARSKYTGGKFSSDKVGRWGWFEEFLQYFC